MDTPEHRGEIRIGKDEWLPFFELEGRYESAAEIDHLLHETSQVWAALETQCVAGCCGIDAFEFWPEHIAKAAEILDIPVTIRQIERLQLAAECTPAEVLLSRSLNCYFDKRQFLMLLDHLLRSFKNAQEA